MNLNKIIIIISLLFSFNLYSQGDTTKYPKVDIIGEDTVIIFTLIQTKELAKINEKLKECDTINSILEKQLDENDTIIFRQQVKINNLDEVVEDYKVISKNKDDKLTICENEKSEIKDEVKRQKRHKWIAIVGGSIIAMLGILF